MARRRPSCSRGQFEEGSVEDNLVALQATLGDKDEEERLTGL